MLFAGHACSSSLESAFEKRKNKKSFEQQTALCFLSRVFMYTYMVHSNVNRPISKTTTSAFYAPDCAIVLLLFRKKGGNVRPHVTLISKAAFIRFFRATTRGPPRTRTVSTKQNQNTCSQTLSIIFIFTIFISQRRLFRFCLFFSSSPSPPLRYFLMRLSSREWK